MKCLIILAVVAMALSQPIEVTEDDLNQWELFKIAYQKNYENDNEEVRMQVFLKNLKKVEAHNAKYERGETSYTMAINKMADLTMEEVYDMYANLRVTDKPTAQEVFYAQEGVEVPSNKDWRKQGAVTAVKNQGSCGSCWAFSAIGSIEGQHFLSTKKLVSLSEQNLVDCAMAHGCNGSVMDYAFLYVIKNQGVDTESAYPYLGTQGHPCNYKAGKSGAVISSYVDIEKFSEKALQQAVAKVGPIAVSIDVTDNLFLYSSGVFDDSTCNSTMFSLNHGTLAIGYGHLKKGGDYWLIKNSWGQDWGMKGFAMLSRNKDNQCGIATMASYPMV